MIVWLAAAAKERMLAEARQRRTAETGGGLFGYVARDAIVVEHAAIAGGTTKRTGWTFVPDPTDLQRQIDEIIAATNGHRYLVGEWHTHPLGLPYLSPTDKTSVRRTATSSGTNLEQPTAIVVAPTAIPRTRERIGAFVWDPATKRPIKRPVREYP
jgi:integrative and conjugative element protein (TIGR02256 family)